MAEPDSTKPSPNAAQETGWAGIEDHMREYDEGEMKVLNDDIDALLIFAGLFSAVLTAFVVPSYLLLQPDNSQLSVQILDRISAQLARFEIVPPFINSTAPDTSASPPFQVSTSARWMNCLWFLSLIFSLSSALFGILAKQWIREYLQWRKVAAAPRENVLLRQLRIEAWEDWKVSAGISAIPALLELAVVLFLAGLVVLVWTLDTVVAIVITTAVSVVIMVLCTVTVLPAVYRRCPYKSPTGWACVIIFDALTWVLRCIPLWATNGVIILRHAWRAMICLDLLRKLAKILRRWFVQSAAVPDERGDNEDGLHEDSEESPASERKSIPSFPRFPNWRERDLYIDDLGSSEISNINDIGYPYPDKTDVAKDICEVMPLVRALSWVRKGTEDPRLLKHVATSAESLHTDDLDGEDRYYVFMYVLRKLCSAKSKSRELKPLSDLEGQLRSTTSKAVGGEHHMFRGGVLSGYSYLDLRVHEFLDDSDLWVLGFLLLGDIMYMLDDSSNRLLLFACLSQHMFSVFRYNQYIDMGRTRLQKIYNDAIDSQTTSHQKRRSRGVHTMILEVLCSVSEVHMAEGTKRISADGPRVSGPVIDNDMCLAVQMFDQNVGYSDPFARHQFVMMADLVMRSLNECLVEDEALMGTLLEKMSEAVTISLKEGYENCGCNHTLPWISSMVSISDGDMETFLPSQPLWLLLDVLEKMLPAVASNEEDLDEVDGTDEESNPDEVMAGRKTFIKLKKQADRLYPRLSSPSIALAAEPGPITSVAEDVELSESIPSGNPASVIDAKNEAVGMRDRETQHGGKEDILVPESHSQAARPSEGISVHTVGHPAEETQEICASSLDHQDLTSIRHMELDVPIDRQDAVPSPEQDPDITAEGDSNHVAPFFTEPWTGQSNSFEVAASDDSRSTARMLPINPGASDGLPSTRSLSHASTAHTDTPLAFSDDVADPGDPGRLGPTLQPSESTADLGRIITRSSSTSRDEDVQPVEQSLNSTEPLGEGPDSIEMAQRGGGASQAR